MAGVGIDQRLRGLLHTLRVLLREWRGAKLEPETLFMDRFLRPDSVCLHVGASDGRHCFHMARRVPGGIVHCIEPSAYTLGILGRLARLLRIANLSLHNIGLSDANAPAWLVTPVKTSGHLGRAFAYVSIDPPDPSDPPSGFTGLVSEEIALHTLDSFCDAQGIGRIDFLRCDTEGSEHAILEGGRAVLERDRPVLMIEVHPHALAERFGSSADAVWALLTGLGYRMFHLDGGRLVPAGAFFDEPWRDYFCVPAGRLAAFGLDGGD